MAKTKYHLHLKGYVGGYDFDSDYVDYVLAKHPDTEVHVLIDSLGGSLATALSIVAAFREHGNVHVHFVGMNASAATIVSMGAKRITMDASAMYLVHKCSVEFFRWASANSDKLADIIREAKQMKSDLEKMDANVAQLYAAKCQKAKDDLLALMKKGGWLTAQEALEWGFVDEVTDFEEDAAPVITEAIAADMGAAGIPVPSHVAKEEQGSSLMARFIEALSGFFKSNNSNPNNEMNPTTTQQEVQQVQAPETQTQNEHSQEAQAQEQTQQGAQEVQQSQATAQEDVVSAQAHADAIAAKDTEIATLKAQIEALKKTPGDSTSQVVEDEKKNAPDEDPSSAEAFFATRQRAQALYDSIPR